MSGDSVSEIEAKNNALQVASTNFGAKLYKAGAGASEGQQSAAGSSGEDVVDADFEEIEDGDGKRHG
jgi:molecular chaperone DnaK